MATATAKGRANSRSRQPQAANKSVKVVDEAIFTWEGTNKDGKKMRGEIRSASKVAATTQLRRLGIKVEKIEKPRWKMGGKIKEKDVAMFARQLATMMRAGVPMVQSFEIVGRGNANPAMGRLIIDIKEEVEKGSSFSEALTKHPKHFDALFCNLIAAGEQGGILDTLLEKLATYREKMLAIKGKIKSALFYPVAVVVVAFIIVAVIMIYVIPAFKDIFKGFGAELPYPTQVVMAISDFFVNYWYLIFGAVGFGVWSFINALNRSESFQIAFDRFMLKAPIFGNMMRKSAISRWTSTLATLFAAGVPLVESLDSVAGAAGNHIYRIATETIKNEVSTGTTLTLAMQNSGIFPSMVIQMTAIGEESGALDSMLAKVAEFYEREVDEAVDSLTSMLEPLIMVVLGTLIGGIIVAMYLPIFKMGSSV